MCIRDRYDSYTLAADLAVNDEILLADLPEGAKLLDAVVKSPSLGTTGILEMGIKASEDRDGNTLAEDSDYLVDSADAGGQAVFARMGASAANLEPGFGVTLGQATQPYLLCTEASDAGTGVKIEVAIYYSLY